MLVQWCRDNKRFKKWCRSNRWRSLQDHMQEQEKPLSCLIRNQPEMPIILVLSAQKKAWPVNYAHIPWQRMTPVVFRRFFHPNPPHLLHFPMVQCLISLWYIIHVRNIWWRVYIFHVSKFQQWIVKWQCTGVCNEPFVVYWGLLAEGHSSLVVHLGTQQLSVDSTTTLVPKPSVVPRCWQWPRDKESAFPCCFLGRWRISKANSAKISSQHATCPSGSWKFFSHRSELWSVRALKHRP